MPDIEKISAILEYLYPDAVCSLEYDGDPWRLLAAARLSAQCTDERVNIVCVPLFEKYPTAADMAEADIGELEAIIRPCGLYHTKAESLIASAKIITEQHGGQVPDTMDELLALPGVGRKIANLVLGDVFGKPGIVADTHCIRINGRFGFYPETLKDPAKVEKILDTIVPKETQADYCHRMVLFGREYCIARSPRCTECPLKEHCRMGSENKG
jgi:endonuclease-3